MRWKVANACSSWNGLSMARASGRAVLIAWLVLTGTATSWASDFRTWTDSTGIYQREAKLQGRNGDTVTLLLRSGKSTRIAFEKLSKQDQEFVEAQGRAKDELRMTFRQLLATVTLPKYESQLTPDELEACERIGKEIEGGVSRGEDVVGQWINIVDMAKRSIEGLGVPEEVADAVITNTANDIKGALGAKTLSATGRPKYLHACKRGGNIELNYRALDAAGAPVYFSLMLGSSPVDPVPVEDVFIYAAGEAITRTVRRGMMLVAASANPDFVETLQGEDAEFIHSGQSLGRFNALMAENRKHDALEVLKGLPANRTLLYLRLSVASQLDGPEFEQACEDYKRAFPSDRTLCFVSLSPSLLRGNSDEALLAANEIEKQIGPDPYLDLIRGNLADGAGLTDQAISFWIKAVAAERDLMPAYEALRRKFLARKDYENVAEVLQSIEEEFKVDLGTSVLSEDASTGFLSSSSGKRWLNSKTQSKEK